MPEPLNYASGYNTALDQAFPYVLNFGHLYNTPNNGRYRWVNAKTIEIPTVTTTGRVDADRDTVETAKRNYSNSWQSKTLANFRKWSTLVHPMDIDETMMVTSIQNITQVYNEQQKFPEMDAYVCSKLYKEFTDKERTALTGAPTTANILGTFDTLMTAMTEKRVPSSGRILYLTPTVYKTLRNADKLQRTLEWTGSSKGLTTAVHSLDEVQIVQVPSDLMRTAFDFTEGWADTEGAKQVYMILVHPLAVITPVKYGFAKLDPPAAMSEGKYVYYEESYEDVFLLDNKLDAIQFVIEA